MGTASRSDPERPLSVRNAFAVWMDQAWELDALRRFIVLPGARDALEALARLPESEGERRWARSGGTGETVAAWDRRIGIDGEPGAQGADRFEAQLAALGDGSGLSELFAATSIVADLWRAENGENALSLALVMPKAPATEAEVTTDGAALVFAPGSLATYFTYKTMFRVAKWGLVFTLKRGRAGSQIAEELYRGLRSERAAQAKHKLLDIREAHRGMIFDKCGVVVFLHGLLSSDLVLFDPIIDRLYRERKFKDRYVFLGFPHDTFASIDTNAEDLIEALGLLLENDKTTPVGFVCHSRGGLVARRVAANLYASDPARWGKQLGCCVTFGTPHKGSPIAERGHELMAAMLVGMRVIQPDGFLGVGDVLALVDEHKGELPGIEEMVPIGAVRKRSGVRHFLETLRNDERVAGGTHGCELPLLAVGGEAPYDWRLHWMTGHLFRDKRNDCAVTLESSAPRLVGVASETVVSNHFRYFIEGHGFDRAVAFMKERLAYLACGDKTNVSVSVRRALEAPEKAVFPKKKR